VNIALWISQVLLALGFLFAGWMHAIRFQEAKKRMAWVRDVPEPLARLIGVRCDLPPIHQKAGP
jgi:hypothetical protein